MMKLIKYKKGVGAFDMLGSLAISVAVLAIVLVIAFLVMANAKTQIGTTEGIDTTNVTQCQTSSACNATTSLQVAAEGVAPWIPLVIITAIGAVLIGLVKMFKKS